MRSFNEFEKSLIREIINTPIEKKNADGEEVVMRCGDTLLRNFLKCVEIKIMPDKNSFELHFENEKNGSILNDLFDIISLIKYLEENSYLGIYTNPNASDSLDFIDPKYKKGGENFSFVNPRPVPWMGMKTPEILIPQPLPKYIFNYQIAADVQRLCSSTYHPTSALIDLAKDFKTPEMRIAEKNIKVAWWAIGTAVFTSLISIIIQLCK